MWNELQIFIKPLVLTLLFELSAAFLLGLRRKELLLVFLVNVITNPALVLICVFLMYNLGRGIIYLSVLLVLEMLVVYVEYLYFRNYLPDRKSPLFLSLILNLVSFIGGLLCQLFY